MRLRLSSALLALRFAAEARASTPLHPRVDATEDAKAAFPLVADAYILEVSRSSLASAAAKLEAAGATIRKTFDSDVFSGLAVMSKEHNVDELSLIAGAAVLRGWPQASLSLTRPVKSKVGLAADAAGDYNIHKYTGVQKAHDLGIRGKGVVVAVVDTGVDWRHPALGAGFGPGFKVAGGYDLVGDEGWNPDYGDKGKVPDDDPMDLDGHGTHVSGIIAADNEHMTGVAPDATLLVYKVMSGDLGYTNEETVMEAFLRAYEDGADVITASIGGGPWSGYSHNPWAVVASRIAESGVVVTIAAGNDGESGPLWSSDGSSGLEVLAVASANPMEIPGDPFDAAFFDADGLAVNVSTFAYMHYADPWLEVAGREVYVLPDGVDSCETLPDGVPDLSSYVVLIPLSTSCDAYTQAYQVAQKNAQYLLAYESGRGLDTTLDLVIGMAEIDRGSGEQMVAAIREGGKVILDFTRFSNHKFGMYNSAGGMPSYFTTWGPTYELDVKPDIAAPGGDIYSTWLDGSYAVESGTSMATPYVAGIAALYISRFGGRSVHGPGFAKMLHRRIIASAGTIPWGSGSPFWASTAQVGNGMVDAWKLLSYDTQIEFEKMRLNDTGHFTRYHDVTLTNAGTADVTYKFSHQPAAGFEAFGPWGQGFIIRGLPEPMVMSVNVTLPRTLKLGPGQSKKVTVAFKPTEGLIAENMPIYSGKILISGSNAEELSVPYVGAGFDLKTTFRRNLLHGMPVTYAGVNDDELLYYHKFDFNLSSRANNFPKIHDRSIWGVDEWRWDIFEAGWNERNWKYPPVVGKNGYVGSVAFSTYSAYSHNHFDPDTMDPEDTISFPLMGLHRSGGWKPFWWLGKLANGTYITPGNYTMRFAASIPFGDKTHSDNWQVREFPEIQVLPLARTIPAS